MGPGQLCWHGPVAGGLEPSQGSRDNNFPAVIPEGPHPIPSRTRKLRPPGPMVLQGKLCGRVGRRRELFGPRAMFSGAGFFLSERILVSQPRSALQRPSRKTRRRAAW